MRRFLPQFLRYVIILSATTPISWVIVRSYHDPFHVSDITMNKMVNLYNGIIQNNTASQPVIIQTKEELHPLSDVTFVTLYFVFTVSRGLLHSLDMSLHVKMIFCLVSNFIAMLLLFFMNGSTQLCVFGGAAAGLALSIGANLQTNLFPDVGTFYRENVIYFLIPVLVMLFYFLPFIAYIVQSVNWFFAVLSPTMARNDFLNPEVRPDTEKIFRTPQSSFHIVSVVQLSHSKRNVYRHFLVMKSMLYDVKKTFFLSFFVCRLSEMRFSSWDTVHAIVLFYFGLVIFRNVFQKLAILYNNFVPFMLEMSFVGLSIGSIAFCVIKRSDYQVHWSLFVIAVSLSIDEIQFLNMQHIAGMYKDRYIAYVISAVGFVCLFLPISFAFYPHHALHENVMEFQESKLFETSIPVMVVGSTICICLYVIVSGLAIVYKESDRDPVISFASTEEGNEGITYDQET